MTRGLLVVWVFTMAAVEGAELAVVNLAGNYSAIVTIRNPDGTPAAGKKYRLNYLTPSERQVILNKGTALETKFEFEPVRLSATIAAGEIPPNGKIHFNGLAGEPRKFGLQVGEDGSRPGDMPEGFLQISFPDSRKKTNEFTLDLARVIALGQPAPDFQVYDVFSGRTLTYSNFAGKLLILKFWATTCGACLPQLEEHHQVLQRRKRDWEDKVVFLTVSLDEDENKLREHIHSHGWNDFQHVWTKEKESGFDSEIAKSYGVRALPTTYIVHPSGVVVWRGIHFDPVENVVKHLLENVRTPEDVAKLIETFRSARR